MIDHDFDYYYRRISVSRGYGLLTFPPVAFQVEPVGKPGHLQGRYLHPEKQGYRRRSDHSGSLAPVDLLPQSHLNNAVILVTIPQPQIV